MNSTTQRSERFETPRLLLGELPRPARQRVLAAVAAALVAAGFAGCGSLSSGGGSESGDILKSINGHPVASVQEAIAFVRENQGVYDRWEVVVERQGRAQTIVYDSPQN